MMQPIYGSRLRLGCALLLGVIQAGIPVGAQEVPPRRYAVQLSAQVQQSTEQIVLSWPAEGDAKLYQVSRRKLDSGWQPIAELGGGETSFTDRNVDIGTAYEYQVLKETYGTYKGYGYIRSGIQVPAAEDRGTLILLVENGVASSLDPEIKRLQSDLVGDGWSVIRRNVSSSDSPQAVKQLLNGIYNADPLRVKALFLLGHVPVPYSGDFFPDGHENHQGAWPADAYYADLDGTWTDSSVTSTVAERQVNWNVPGDGKLDQTNIPSSVELIVGRVDLSNLTCYANKANARSEIDLTRQYLNKDHAFRFGEVTVEKRGLICDNFSDKGADPISGSAWRNFAPLLGPGQVTEVGWNEYIPAATTNSYLWSYGSGGGSYYYSSGVATSDDFALNDLRVVFTMFMGSYFGDWNNESNFLRAALGSGYVLTTSYSGFPQSLYFPMGLGETIGYCMALTQNNPRNGPYPPWNKGAGQVHVALLGDPTLRMAAVRPPQSFSASSGETVSLRWEASPDAIAGYNIYRAPTPEGPFTRLNSQPITQTSYTDRALAGDYSYMVRALKLENSGSGTYWNLSQGLFARASSSGSTPPAGPLVLEMRTVGSKCTLHISGSKGQSYKVLTSPDFVNWTEFKSGTLQAESMEIPVNLGARHSYYRAESVP